MKTNRDISKETIEKISRLDIIITFLERCDKKPGYRFVLGCETIFHELYPSSYSYMDVPINDDVEKVLINHYKSKREELIKTI